MEKFIGAFFLVFFLQLSALADSFEEQDFGLWIEAEGKVQPFSSAANFSSYLKFTKSAQFTDLYCQVYRGGRSWFPSMLADDTPYRKAERRGFDPLAETIRTAHRRGQKVHAWINTLRVAHNRNAPLFKILGKKVALHDSFGNSLLNYSDSGEAPGQYRKHYRLGTPGIWLDPSHKELREYLTEVVREIVIRYPKLDGIHLDMTRMPLPQRKTRGENKLRFGYGKQVTEQFRYLNSIAPGKISFGKLWNDWRRSQTSLLVLEIRELLEEIAPGMQLTAAVVGKPQRAYKWAKQDWGLWLESGIIDKAIPMAYSMKVSDINKIAKFAVSKRGKGKVVMGLGAWLMLDKPKLMLKQLDAAASEKTDGVALFSYSNLQNQRGRKLLAQVDSYLAKKAK